MEDHHIKQSVSFEFENMKAIFVAVIVCSLVFQLTEAKPAKAKKGTSKTGGSDIQPPDPEEMRKHCSEKCLQFLIQPKNQQKLETMSNTDPPGCVKLMLDNDCKSLLDYLNTHLQG